MSQSRKRRLEIAGEMLCGKKVEPSTIPEPIRDPIDLVREILNNTTYPDTMTLGELRVVLLKRMIRGVRCPLCTHRVALRVRPFSYPILQALRWLVQASGEKRRWVHVPSEAPSWFLRSRQHSALALWGMAETFPVKSSDSPGEGTWRPTKKGVSFVQGWLKVPSKAVIYNSKVLGFEGELVTLSDIKAMPSDLSGTDPIPSEIVVKIPEPTDKGL